MNPINPITISIIIPTLNSAKTLKGCLESIAIQDYPKDRIEIIIADGGSIDGTIELIEKIANRQSHFPVFHFPFPISQINDLLAFIDSDNILPLRT